jgi:hypothetical protein
MRELCAGLLKDAGSTTSRNAEFIGSFPENREPNRAAARHTEPCGRRRLGGTRDMTVACDGGAGAQAGIRHKGTKDVPPQPRGIETHTASWFCD